MFITAVLLCSFMERHFYLTHILLQILTWYKRTTAGLEVCLCHKKNIGNLLPYTVACGAHEYEAVHRGYFVK